MIPSGRKGRHSDFQQDSGRRLSGGAELVIEKIDRDVFDHLAGLFLGDLLYEVVRGEERSLPPRVKVGLRPVVQARADRLVADFERRFHGKPLGPIERVSHGHLFEVMAANRDWLVEELRR